MKDSYYFPHDYHARHDPKLAALIKVHGAVGYGVWWAIVEMLHEQGGKLEKFPMMLAGMASEMKQTEAVLEALLRSLIDDFRLLSEDENYIWSDRVNRNIQTREQKRLQKVEAGRVGGIISGLKRSGTKHRLKQNEANEAKESKEKEIKEKKGEFVYLQDPKFLRAFKDYLDMRVKLRKPATEKAQEMILRTLHVHDITTAIKMLNNSILNSWTGVFIPKGFEKKATRAPEKDVEYEVRQEERDKLAGLIHKTVTEMKQGVEA